MRALAIISACFFCSSLFGQICPESAEFNNAGKLLLHFLTEAEADIYADTNGNGETGSCPTGETCDQLTSYTATGSGTSAGYSSTGGQFKDAPDPRLRLDGGTLSTANTPFEGEIVFNFSSSPSLTCNYNSAGILPIELVNFEVEMVNNEALVSWTTASEINSHFISLEKSLDGVNFKELKRFYTPEISTTVKRYKFVDKNIGSGVSYYRLYQEDLDGKSFNSKLVSISKDDLDASKAYQGILSSNMVSLGTDLNTDFEPSGDLSNYRLKIFDPQGTPILDLAYEGKNMNINTIGFKTGLYYISVISPNEVFSDIFILK